VFHLDISKIDLEEHILQWSQWSADCGMLQPPAAARVLLRVTCGRLRLTDASATCIRRRGEAGALLYVKGMAGVTTLLLRRHSGCLL
jgi:hypothetical protein